MKGQKARKGTLKKVLQYIRPYWALVGLSILLAAVTVVGTVYSHPHRRCGGLDRGSRPGGFCRYC